MTPSEVVRSVIRGDSPLSALLGAGISVSRGGRVSDVQMETIHPALEDLSSGYKKHAGRRSLRMWALLILHAPFIEIDPLPDSPEWDAILGSIWDAAGVP